MGGVLRLAIDIESWYLPTPIWPRMAAHSEQKPATTTNPRVMAQDLGQVLLVELENMAKRVSVKNLLVSVLDLVFLTDMCWEKYPLSWGHQPQLLWWGSITNMSSTETSRENWVTTPSTMRMIMIRTSVREVVLSCLTVSGDIVTVTRILTRNKGCASEFASIPSVMNPFYIVLRRKFTCAPFMENVDMIPIHSGPGLMVSTLTWNVSLMISVWSLTIIWFVDLRESASADKIWGGTKSKFRQRAFIYFLEIFQNTSKCTGCPRKWWHVV